ncbi:MAG: organomercurial lyase [Terriglobales bacterium]
MTSGALDNSLRLAIYRNIVDSGVAPTRDDIARELNLPRAEIEAGFVRLAANRILVLQASGEILMASPFSAIPTGFEVIANGKHWWGNCIWDALGVLAAIDRDGLVRASCGCCGTAMEVTVERGACHGGGVAHFGVPAQHWWDDIVFN